MSGLTTPAVPATVPFAHLSRLTDATGLFEHAKLLEPRTGHGYCVDDVARGLVVTAREPSPTPDVRRLSRTYRRFIDDAQAADGRFHNRRGLDGSWEDEPCLEDCWGRALWALGTVIARSPATARGAQARFELGAGHRPSSLRSVAFAALGAAEVLTSHPGHRVAGSLLADTAALVPGGRGDPRWPWPEPRLRYANAVLPEVLIAAGSLLGDAGALGDGLVLLTWLLDVETADGHLSVTPVGGWGPGEARPGFDQQPIEVAALADACGRAFEATADPFWAAAVTRCANWFLGANDVRTQLYDAASGGGCDGLERGGRNENQGAESTLAMISTFQQSRRLSAHPR